jgi:protein disulfide-isomerase-like protein
MKSFALLVSTIYITSAQGAVPSLTPDNFDALTAGKTVFIKFFAPWCGHCKTMAPDWEKLSGEFADSATALVAEVDCTAEGKPLCDANEVKGFPTLLYGDPSMLQKYGGPRDYDGMQKFAEENLKPMCSPNNIDLCDDDTTTEIKKFQAIVGKELDALIAVGEKKIDEAEATFKAEVEKLKQSYEALTKEKDDADSSGLALMKLVKAAKIETASS